MDNIPGDPAWGDIEISGIEEFEHAEFMAQPPGSTPEEETGARIWLGSTAKRIADDGGEEEVIMAGLFEQFDEGLKRRLCVM